MDSEDSQDANSRDCASSGSSSSYEDDGPASPNQNSRPESRSDDPESPDDRSASLDKPSSPYDENSVDRPDSWNGQNENSGDGNQNENSGPESPADSINNTDQPKSPYSSDNDEPNSPEGPMSPKSDNEKDNEPMSPDQSSVKSPLSNQSSVRQSRSRSRSTSPKSHKSSRSGNRSGDGQSDSSSSSRESSRSRSRPPEPPMEEISDCDMESDHNTDNEDNSLSNPKSVSSPTSVKSESKANENNLNMSHEDLSDVSDLDSNAQSDVEESKPPKSPVQAPQITDLRQKLDEAKKQQNSNFEKITSSPDDTKQQSASLTIVHKTNEDAEEALDFEAEEGECPGEPAKVEANGKTDGTDNKSMEDNDGEIEEGEELEEGEVTDGEENRPEETEPRPVCRFFARGQCTWGISCRFLHPGVTDKGNYTMFDMVRPIAAGPAGHAPGFGVHHDYRTERPVHMFPPPAVARPGGIPGEAPIVESAWERGLRTAKEMMRKANKRKEQDMDFEEKKMNLTIGQDEIERENGYYARAASPPRPLSPELPYIKPRHLPHDAIIPRKEDYFRRHYEDSRLIRMEPPIYDDLAIERERLPRYRELPPHRMPQYEEDELLPPEIVKRRARPAREVIVQRAEPITRGDEWADPWMRSKSPGSRRPKERTARRSYSSGSSYSSSSSSSAKSRSPRSRSPHSRGAHGGTSTGRRRARVSPSVIVSERRAASERALLMNPPAPSPRKRPHSPAMMRRHAQNPPAPPVTSTKSSSSTTKTAIKINRDQTDAFGRVRRDVDRTSERIRRESLTNSSKGSHKSPYKRDSRDSRRTRDGRSASSNSGSSDSSSSDSGSSYTSSSSSRDRSPASSKRLVENARLRATVDRSKVRPRSPTERKRDDSRKAIEVNRKRPASSPGNEDVRDKGNKSPGGPKKASRREELLKQLKAVEDAIARKRSKND